jgi:hypothetical protein
MAASSTKKTAPVADEAPTIEVQAETPPTDHNDLLANLHKVKKMSEAADQIAAALVGHERRLSRIDHGHFRDGGYPAQTTADDHIMRGRLRTLASACTEFSMAIRRGLS